MRCLYPASTGATPGGDENQMFLGPNKGLACLTIRRGKLGADYIGEFPQESYDLF